MSKESWGNDLKNQNYLGEVDEF